MLNHLRKHNRLLYALAVLVLATGIRRGEACGLCWKDFDSEAGLLRVERSLETTKEEGLRIKSPKTRHGRRASQPSGLGCRRAARSLESARGRAPRARPRARDARRLDLRLSRRLVAAAERTLHGMVARHQGGGGQGDQSALYKAPSRHEPDRGRR